MANGDIDRQLGAIPFGALIGGPLNAAIEAQAKAATTSLDFIRAVGFDDKDEVQNVKFTYTSDGAANTMEVPLLTIVPIPFIRIDDMTIDFKANMSVETSSSDKKSQEVTKGVSATVGGRYLFVKAEMSASYSSKKDSSSTRDSRYSVEYTVDVHVHAVQDDAPAGLSKVLNILVDSIDNGPEKPKK